MLHVELVATWIMHAYLGDSEEELFSNLLILNTR